ncbi:ATP-dependent RNA helicase dbp9 [Clavulina sp. PMI_390]|nr:ATP-dependent RNA helicase dbp9 [Clavulina sp. PMI_390]
MADATHLDPKLSFSSAFVNVIDKRLLKALGEMGFARPTLIQTQAIPLALEGRDILARARTGSGKTAAYCIPLVQKILQAKSAGSTQDDSTRGLILVPTKELAEQVTAYLRKLLIYCEKTVKVTNVASGASGQMQRMLLADVPDIVISTPARVLGLLNSNIVSLAHLETLVIDEADLILSYGHDADVRTLLSGDHLPKVYQSLLMSATMTEDVNILKGLILRNPAVLHLEETKDEAANLSQYFVRCNETDKFLLIYVILKLKLVQGKCILFLNDVDRCYRLKLFLEQFSIKSCVLNAEMPINSRFHIVQEFNKGVYDYILASDESAGQGEVDQELSDSEEEDAEAGDDDEDDDQHSDEEMASPAQPASKKRKQSPLHSPQPPAKRTKNTPTPTSMPATAESSSTAADDMGESAATSSKPQKRKRPGATDKEFGVSRGVDFVDVACVVNFDLPTSSRGYTHRVGRTARAGRSGLAISFVVPASDFGKNKIVSCPTAKGDEKVFKRIEEEQGARGSKLKEYEFDKKQVEAFRYRMEDALRSVTRVAIKEAKVKELKAEILKSDKLKAHFEDHPLDLEYLRHDKPLRPTRIQAHMKHVPKYLVPRIAAVPNAAEDGTVTVDASTVAGTVEAGTKDVGFVPFRKQNSSKRGGHRGGKSGSGSRGGRGGGKGRKNDPLKKFGK